MARPPLPAGAAASATVTVRLTPADQTLLAGLVALDNQAAEAAGLSAVASTTTVVRSLIARAARERGLLPPAEPTVPARGAPLATPSGTPAITPATLALPAAASAPAPTGATKPASSPPPRPASTPAPGKAPYAPLTTDLDQATDDQLREHTLAVCEAGPRASKPGLPRRPAGGT